MVRTDRNNNRYYLLNIDTRLDYYFVYNYIIQLTGRSTARRLEVSVWKIQQKINNIHFTVV